MKLLGFVSAGDLALEGFGKGWPEKAIEIRIYSKGCGPRSPGCSAWLRYWPAVWFQACHALHLHCPFFKVTIMMTLGWHIVWFAASNEYLPSSLRSWNDAKYYMLPMITTFWNNSPRRLENYKLLRKRGLWPLYLVRKYKWYFLFSLRIKCNKTVICSSGSRGESNRCSAHWIRILCIVRSWDCGFCSMYVQHLA